MNKNNYKTPWWRDGLIIFTRVSSYIVVPVILGSIIGKYLDNKYNTGNLLFYISIGIAFISTIYLIGKEVKRYKRSLEKQEQNNNNL